MRPYSLSRTGLLWLLPAGLLLPSSLKAQLAVFEQPCGGPPACSFHIELYGPGGGPMIAELDYVPADGENCGTQRVDISSLLSSVDADSAYPPELKVWSVGCSGTFSVDADWLLVESDPDCYGITKSSHDGRVNSDGSVDISDAVRIFMYLFDKAPRPCANAADVNNDGAIDLTDAICIVGELMGQSACSSGPRQ